MRVCVTSMTMESNKIKDVIIEHYADTDDILFADGFDDAIIGFEPNLWKVVYSRQKCIEVLSKEDDINEEEALDYLEYNTFNAYVGDKTPVWVEDFGWY
jgi:hypothetical protein